MAEIYTYTYNLNLDLSTHPINSITIKQYGKNTYYLNISVTQKGVVYIIDPASYRAYFKMKTPDKRYIYQLCEIDESGRVICELPESAAWASGVGEAEIEVIKNDGTVRMSTCSFEVVIDPSAYPEEEITGSNDFSALVDYVSQAGNMDQQVQEAQEAAETASSAQTAVTEMKTTIEGWKTAMQADKTDTEEAKNTAVEAQASALQSAQSASADAEELSSMLSTAMAMYNGPLTASDVSQMTDHTKVYVFTGTDVAGMNKGDWYYWDNSATAWVSGGQYLAGEITVDDTLTQTGQAADAKKTGDEITSIKSDLSAINSEIINGNRILASSDFSQGSWSMTAPSGVVTAGTRNIHTTYPISVQSGDILTTEQSSLYIRWALFDNNDNVVEEFKGTYDKQKITSRTYTFTHSGKLYINIANGHNYGNSTDIVPSDLTAIIKVETSYAAREIEKIKPDIEDLKINDGYLFNTVINETPSASEPTYFYIPYDFAVGQTYIIKITFTSFSSSTNRKYSIITSKSKSTSSANKVQGIAVINAIAPILNVEYEYRFTAISREDGGVAHYLVLELSVNAQSTCTLTVKSVKAEDAQTELDKLDYITATDIVSLNHDVPSMIRQGAKPFNRATTVPLSLFHFSDIHGKKDNLQRIVDMIASLGTLIDDAVCTGDIVTNNYSATCMDFWDDVDGSENILICIGNHDVADGTGGYSSDQIGQELTYNTYFSPYIENWGVTSPGENLTYWYKDYSAKKVRIIALNYLLTGDEQTAQNSWLASRLTEAKTNNYAVVILEHTPLNSFTNIDCNFSIIGLDWTYNEFPTIYQDTVQSFIDGGGEFVCYLAGHCHRDYVGYNSNYPDQLCVAITTAQTTGYDNDQRRVIGEKSQDAANIFMVDTVTKSFKLIRVGADMDCYLRGRNLFSINYLTKTVIANA